MVPHEGNPQLTDCRLRTDGQRTGVTSAVMLAGLLMTAVLPPWAVEAADPEAGCHPIETVPPGTLVDNPAGTRWNRVLLLAVPRIARGDTEAVAQAVRERVSRFTLVLLATVRQTGGPAGQARHELAGLGVGYAVPVDGRLTVVAADDLRGAAGIDFIGQLILAENGRNLAGLTCVGSSDTVQVFDAEAILFREGAHRDYFLRHFIWVEPASGRCSTCIWLLSRNAAGSLAVVEEPIRWIRPGTREDRVIHVDASRFLLGVPTRRAFALIDMPPGQALDWSPSLRGIAAEKRYTPEGLRSLALALDQSLETLRTPHRADRQQP